MDDDGFFMGELNGVRGLVPSNFLTEAPLDYETGARGGGRRPMPPHLGPPDHRRPPGPGARGPPPPPREGAAGGHGPPHARDERGVRKGRKKMIESTLSSKFGNIIDALRNHYDGQADPRGGRAGGAGRGRGGPSSSASSGANPPGHPSDRAPGDLKPTQQRTGRGVPAVLPEFSPVTEPPDPAVPGTSAAKVTSTVTSTTTTTGTSANPITSKLPGVLAEAPGSLMQKFSDLTHTIGGGGAEGGEGSILSKGKDLIFKRFGL
ncbi:RIMS-binding protein 2 [Orchesella cincta]|uniref:RIMS-binding protein 2 n=1 Tax=Orchesella cincta TaxID=48709 RepID=A0A1D2N9S5_ORCCI|nr:RIMS-binding protein 2 [Orchesella cincta]